MHTLSSLLRKSVFFVLAICLGFFQAVIFISDSCAQSTPAPQATGPVDIQANEQEFADKVVVAKGNVVVKYKDSVITAPEVKLFRDDAGQPQRAVFVGQPHLTQGDSKINADTLIFEIANSKFTAQGNAHSEVISSGDSDIDPKAPPGTKAQTKKQSTKVSTAANNKNGKQPFAWPKTSDDQTANRSESPTAANNEPSETSSTGSTVANKNRSEKSGKSSSTPAEKIITDSDFQEYEKDSGKFDANGHVHVLHGNISVFADKLRLVYGNDGKPETALFNGHVDAMQEGNHTQAEMMTYYLSTKRLQANGNVRSRMIQQKPNGASPSDKKTIGAKPNAGAVTAAPVPQPGQGAAASDDIIVLSDSQDFNQNTGKMAADGNVRVYYQDTVGVGPKAILLRNSQGRADKVIFTGRSQISQSGKRWIADRITMAVASKKILAEGNTKALILGNPGGMKKQPESNTALAMRPSNSANKVSNTTAGVSPDKNGTAIGSSKIEVIR